MWMRKEREVKRCKNSLKTTRDSMRMVKKGVSCWKVVRLGRMLTSKHFRNLNIISSKNHFRSIVCAMTYCLIHSMNLLQLKHTYFLWTRTIKNLHCVSNLLVTLFTMLKNLFGRGDDFVIIIIRVCTNF